MILKTMWGQRASEPNMPELMVAWDKHSADDFPEGFEKECHAARESWEDDLAAWRMLDIAVPTPQVMAAFATAQIASAVVLTPSESSR